MRKTLNDEHILLIGRIILACSKLEHRVAVAIVVHEFGLGTKPNEGLHKERYRQIARKPFRKRLEILEKILAVLDIEVDEKGQIIDALNGVIKWRDALSHGLFQITEKNEIELTFWDRTSFHDGVGPKTKNFPQIELVQLLEVIISLGQWLDSQFKLQDHKQILAEGAL
ncbi:hypothetical protein [Marivivens sp. JLT3646]|uniref:hypothetical protein n=1 Tax=Marivivens sp. JLT3646 TaxID=1920883 RepID=UPI0007FF1CAC|nr:hypothetical protein [Marivivens sp. JLT3646]APO86876.1 hypothetical protein BSK21_07450 [Marivivens sp. JLT3646]OBR39605.1 hypothetical protein A9199_01125 [Donghicola sp. JL3646]